MPNSTRRDRVTIDSVRNHCGRHFPVQSVAKATYRDILERRAGENRIDFIEGVATVLTPIAFFETVMVKSYETLVDSDTKVDVNTGMVAAGRLQAVIDDTDRGARQVAVLFELALEALEQREGVGRAAGESRPGRALASRRTLRAFAFMTVLPSVTWPSPPSAMRPRGARRGWWWRGAEDWVRSIYSR